MERGEPGKDGVHSVCVQKVQKGVGGGDTGDQDVFEDTEPGDRAGLQLGPQHGVPRGFLHAEDVVSVVCVSVVSHEACVCVFQGRGERVQGAQYSTVHSAVATETLPQIYSFTPLTLTLDGPTIYRVNGPHGKSRGTLLCCPDLPHRDVSALCVAPPLSLSPPRAKPSAGAIVLARSLQSLLFLEDRTHRFDSPRSGNPPPYTIISVFKVTLPADPTTIALANFISRSVRFPSRPVRSSYSYY